MRDLADIHYPDAALIRVVQDNLSTHTAGALYEPKSGSWTNAQPWSGKTFNPWL
jgi:hypothetical protein